MDARMQHRRHTHPGSPHRQTRGHDDIAVFRTSDDRIFAIVDCCPHKGGPLSCGLVHGHAVTCPLHSWTIDLEDGQAHAPDEGRVHKIAVRVDGERIYLNLSTQG